MSSSVSLRDDNDSAKNFQEFSIALQPKFIINKLNPINPESSFDSFSGGSKNNSPKKCNFLKAYKISN